MLSEGNLSHEKTSDKVIIMFISSSSCCVVGIHFLFVFTLSGGCERSCISDIRECLNTHHIFQQKCKCNHKQSGISEQKILPFTFLSEHPCNSGFAFTKLWQATASQMPCNFTIKLCFMWIALPITETLPNQR